MSSFQESLQVLDGIRLNFSPGSLTIMNVILAFVMFGIALQINVSEFKDVIRKPKGFLTGVIGQVFFLPFFTFLLCLALRNVLSQTVVMGMILVAACPGGNISNFITSLARGNVPLAVSMTAFSTLNCVIVTPFNFVFWGKLYFKVSELINPINLNASDLMREIDFWQITQTVLILLGIPIVLGLLFSHYFPKLSKKLIKPMSIYSIVAFIIFIAAALYANLGYFMKYIHLIGLLVIVHNAMAFLLGNISGRLVRLARQDIRALTIEMGIQNSGLGLILIFNPKLFNGLGGMAFIAAWWGIWHIIAGMGVAYFWRLRDRKVKS
jgi:BASS family bile acid:Na+ symporter